MNTQFRDKIKSAGIDFGRFLLAVVQNLPTKKGALVKDAATILEAHLDTILFNDDVPATATAIAKADPNGGFPGAPRPGSTENAVNGHHQNTTAPENMKGYVEELKVVVPVYTKDQLRIKELEARIAAMETPPAPVPALPSGDEETPDADGSGV